MLAFLLLLFVLCANGWFIPTGVWVAAWVVTIAGVIIKVIAK